AQRRVLEAHERVAEVLFGLIMVLTFTGSLSLAQAGRDDVRTMLIGALGCNLAWGVIDGVLYLMGALAEKNRNLQTLHAVRRTADAQQAQGLIVRALPSPVADILEPSEVDSIHRRLQQLPEPPARLDLDRRGPPARLDLDRRDWRGALHIFLVVFLSTFPVALPFVFVHDAALAKRISDLVAVAMLFGAGVIYGRCIGRAPWLIGVAMFALGSVL